MPTWAGSEGHSESSSPISGGVQTFEAIVSSPLNLKSEPWPKVSPAAKELVRKLLHRDPKRRFTADQVKSGPVEIQAEKTYR